MSNIADATFITDLRGRMLKNNSEGRPADYGIDREEIKRGLEIVRSNRTQAVAKSSSKKAKASGPPIDLKALFSDNVGSQDS